MASERALLAARLVDAAPEFELIEIEGDVAFLSRDADTIDGGGPVAAVTQAAAGMHRAFHTERRNVVANPLPRRRVSQADNLKLKFVAHIGVVASQRASRIGRTLDVAGRGLPYMIGLRRRHRVAAQ